MKIEAQFFSRLKDAAGRSQAVVDLPDGATVQELLARLYKDFGALREWDAHIRVAVGVEYVERTAVLHEGDRVAIMPPVQGG